MDDVYLDTLKEQAQILGMEVEDGGKQTSAKDLDRKVRGVMSRRGDEDEDNLRDFQAKRKSTFERDSYSMEKNISKNDTNSSSQKVLTLGYEAN